MSAPKGSLQIQTNSRSDQCVVRIGPMGRTDPDTEIHIVKNVKHVGLSDEWQRVERVFVMGKKAFKFDLEPGSYHVMVIGDKQAGVITTAGNEMPFPFDVFLDPPVDHAKDFMRIDVPANVPVPPTLERAIKAALTEKK